MRRNRLTLFGCGALFVLLMPLDVSLLVHSRKEQSRKRPRPMICTGGVLNGQVKVGVKPVYPERAGKAQAHGNVIVRVLVDEEGKVYEATACAGHELLRPAAADAARRTPFSPTMISGQPVKVAGVLVYVFRRGERTGDLTGAARSR